MADRCREAFATKSFIRKAQSLGFSLEDVRQILDVCKAGRAPCTRILAIAEGHLAELDERIARLVELRNELSRAVKRWRDGGVPTHCAFTLCGMIVEATEPTSNQKLVSSL